MMTVITAARREAAQEKLRGYLCYVSEDGALALMSGWTGLDFSTRPPDELVRFEQRDAMTSALEAFTTADPERSWTMRQIARHAAAAAGCAGAATRANLATQRSAAVTLGAGRPHSHAAN
jgi:hypothetical protein